MKVSAFTAIFAMILASAAGGCERSKGATPERDEANLRAPRAITGAVRPAHAMRSKEWRGLEDGVLRIWPIGDSITEGPEGSYRNALFRELKDEGIKVDFIGTLYDDSAKIEDRQHEGHPGFTIANAEENLDGWLKKVPAPDVVLIMLGTNDFAWWTNVSVLDHYGDMTKLLDHLSTKLPEAKIVVATIPPQSPALIEDVKRDRGQMASEFNDLLRQLLPKRAGWGERLFLADVGARVTTSDLGDGIHPKTSAQKKIAGVWKAALERALSPRPNVTNP